jgi:hypothetical protein
VIFGAGRQNASTGFLVVKIGLRAPARFLNFILFSRAFLGRYDHRLAENPAFFIMQTRFCFSERFFNSNPVPSSIFAHLPGK